MTSRPPHRLIISDVAGVFVSVVSGIDGGSLKEEVTRFCKKYKMQSAAHRQLQEYLAQLEQLSDIVPKPDLFFKLSPALSHRLVLEIHCVWLTKLRFARSLMLPHSPFPKGPQRSPAVSHDFKNLLAQLALTMQPMLFIARERPTATRMYVIIKGMAADVCAMRILSSGDSWGLPDLVLTYTSTNHMQGRVKALMPLQVICIDRDGIDSLLKAHPECRPSYLRVRVWALHRRLYFGIFRAAARRRGGELGELRYVEDPRSEPIFAVGDRGWMANTHFSDGTRLRLQPAEDSAFYEDGRYLLNDAAVTIVGVSVNKAFLEVCALPAPSSSADSPELRGWVRARNVSQHKREAGLAGVRMMVVPAAKPEFGATGEAPEVRPPALPGAATEATSHILAAIEGLRLSMERKFDQLDKRIHQRDHVLDQAIEQTTSQGLEKNRRQTSPRSNVPIAERHANGVADGGALKSARQLLAGQTSRRSSREDRSESKIFV